MPWHHPPVRSRRTPIWVRAVRLMTLLTAAALPACYRVTPLAGPPEPGMRIVAGLTREASERMAEQLGPDVVRIEGEASLVRADRWDLLLLRTWDRPGRVYPWGRETVTFPSDYLVDVRRTEFDRRRTWILTGAGAAAVVVLGRIFFRTILNDGDGGGGDVPAG